jgi:4-amino-4-deoxy-L-arabinose transferase-like glycosyltransferase
LQIAEGKDFRVRIFDEGVIRSSAKAGARLVPLVVIGAAVALRVVPLLARYPLHRDEALYGAWARLIASGKDPFLLTAWVDKPPLVMYLLAASLRALGASDLALRLPGMIASIACVALTYGLACQAYNRRVALPAATLCAFSPFAILFAPTAFTDPWLTVWLLASVWAALAGKSLWAGLLLGLAVASKQQGLLGIPLVLGVLALEAVERAGSMAKPRSVRGLLVRYVLAAVAGFLIIFVPLMYWDSLRWVNRPSFWDRSLQTYGGLQLAEPRDWLNRMAAWMHQGAYFYGPTPVTLLLVGLATLPGILALQRWVRRPRQPSFGFHQRFDLLLLSYVGGYVVLHVLATFQPWDRYLLPLVPILSILAARGLVFLRQRLQNMRKRSAVQLCAVFGLASLLTWASWTGVSGRLPVGSDHGAFDNLDRVVTFVRSRPSSAVVYHHSLGWYFDFYLFDAPQRRPWWENSWQLADLAKRTTSAEPGHELWLVLAGWEDPVRAQIPSALASWGLLLREEQSIQRHDGTLAFSIHRIEPIREDPSP